MLSDVLCYVRGVQTCEGLRPDVVHLSLQLLPYPWFSRQRALYPFIRFPKVKSDASTDITAEYVGMRVRTGALLGPVIMHPVRVCRHVRVCRARSYKRDLTRLLWDNLHTGYFTGGIYLDLQSVVRSAATTVPPSSESLHVPCSSARTRLCLSLFLWAHFPVPRTKPTCLSATRT